MDIYLEHFPILNDLQGILDTNERLNAIRHQLRIPRRILRDQQNPLEYYRGAEEFRSNLIFSKDGFLYILDLFKDKLTKRYNPGSPTISPLLRLTVFLHYLRSNSFYRNESDITYIQLPKSTICDVLNQTAKDIASFSSTYIVFPDEEEKEVIANFFLENFRFPGCVGIFGKLPHILVAHSLNVLHK